MGVHSRLLLANPSNQDPLMTRSAVRSSDVARSPRFQGLEHRAPRRAVRSCNPAVDPARAGQEEEVRDPDPGDRRSVAARGRRSKPEKPAEQAGDTEKPKTILDTSQDAPKTDSLGHVHFGSPNAEGLGRVAVKAAPESEDQDLPRGPLLRHRAADHLQRPQGRLHRRGRVRERQAGVAPGQRRRERRDGGRPRAARRRCERRAARACSTPR